ncbi:MAG TPA: WbqC family protein, partial [Solirubrobacterales bacterium]
MIVTAHQTNLLPGVSVVSKIAAADVFIACDEFQFTLGGFVNRNRLADGTPLTAPYDRRDKFAPINRVRLASTPIRWREVLARTLEQRVPGGHVYAALARRPWRLLVGLNVALLEQLLDDLAIRTEWVFQSHLESGKCYGPIVSDDRDELVPASERLAAMTAEVGGDVYLSGASGRRYLDETPFAERGIRVDYFDPAGPNPSAV